MASADSSPDLPSPVLRFEALPDEILLSICGYLSSVEVLDSFLNLNTRLNRTIAAYREKIFLHHLSHHDFHHLLDDHLPALAANVTYLHINARSMQHSGQFFEQRFPKMDQQFPVLRELVFRHIDTDTLESLAWRFNTMSNLHTLDIDIADDRLPSVPVQFDEFLCGKLFSEANSFRTLALHLNTYKFNLQSLRSKCLNLRQLTISVRHYDDVLILFERCRHLERLTVTVGCCAPSTHRTDAYPYDQLWWRMAYLTHFSLSIEAKELTAHEHVPPSDILLKTIANLFPLTYMKFDMDISFATPLSVSTTKEQYTSKYLSYVDGHGWQRALHRQDNHSIRFEMHVELDGLANYYSQNVHDVDMLFVQKNNGKPLPCRAHLTASFRRGLQRPAQADLLRCILVAEEHRRSLRDHRFEARLDLHATVERAYSFHYGRYHRSGHLGDRLSVSFAPLSPSADHRLRAGLSISHGVFERSLSQTASSRSIEVRQAIPFTSAGYDLLHSFTLVVAAKLHVVCLLFVAFPFAQRHVALVAERRRTALARRAVTRADPGGDPLATRAAFQ